MYLHLMLCYFSFVTEPETRYLNLEPSAAMNGGFVALLKRQVKTYAPINLMPAGGGEAGHRVGI